jgi:hypothetical protein
MRTRTWAAIGVSLVALVATARIVAAAPDRPEPKWAESWQAALAEAKERNVPIIFFEHQDG